MELYLMRHGIAEDAKPGQPDAARPLTEDGCYKVEGVLELARNAGVDPDLILSSPYLRAIQTARIARDELAVREAVLEFPSIVPHGNPETVWNDLRSYAQYRSLFLTGHEPLFSQLAAYLLNSPALLIEVKKASIIRIDVAAMGPTPRGVLRWMMVPAMVD